MSGDLGSFHLAYVPAASIADEAASENDDGDDSNGTDPPMIIRRASALRLYRCRSQHHSYLNECIQQGGDFCTDSSSGNCTAESSEHQSDEDCRCCCCRAETCSPDSLLSNHATLNSFTNNDGLKSAQTETADITGINNRAESLCEASMLAVLVPSSLTRGLVNLVSQNVTANEKLKQNENVKQNERKNCSLEQQHMSQKIIDAEIELRKSIHPCLCPNEPLHAIHSYGVKSNEENDRRNNQKQQTIDENSTTPLNSSQLFVCGIITSNNVSNCTNFPADVVLMAPRKSISTASVFHGRDHLLEHNNIISQYSNLLNHETASNAPWSVIKAFPISTLSILPISFGATKENAIIDRNSKRSLDIAALPCCPVCLNLIEPKRLGLPDLKPHQKCGAWCHEHNGYSQQHSCANEMKFIPWPPPAECIACQQRELSIESNARGPQRSSFTELQLSLSPVAQRSALQSNHHGTNYNDISAPLSHSEIAESSRCLPLTCYRCTISTTLWVCLTCGVIGCGRYTLKHAAEHYALEGHPYSLELATGRIWDYENGNFVHRRDLVECQVLSRKWGIAVSGGEGSSSLSPFVASSNTASSYHGGESNSFSGNNNHLNWRKEGPGDSLNHNNYDGLEDSIASCHSNHNHYTQTTASKLPAPPKKSIMISQEYEALLQSALEDQSQHYQGEISRLRADLASSRMQDTQISDRESREIKALQKNRLRLKQDVEQLSSTLLEAQTKEAKHRSMSQRLLREQLIAKELLEKMRTETLTEHESGKQRMEDLEMQITDLTANLRMMSQFAKNEELSQAQIFGTFGGEKPVKQRGKKNRRGRKKG